MQVANPNLANGTEGQPAITDWQAINWQQAAQFVRNLRQRIFRATQLLKSER